jgi:hypothetical protein
MKAETRCTFNYKDWVVNDNPCIIFSHCALTLKLKIEPVYTTKVHRIFCALYLLILCFKM